MFYPPITPRRVLIAVVGLLLLAGAACESRPPVSQTEEGRLVLGEAAVEHIVERGVMPGGRTLVLQGFKGTVTLDATDAAEASLTFVKHARGKDEEAAQKVLQGIRIEETGSAATFEYLMEAEQHDVSRVDVQGTVPRGTPLRIHLESGDVALSGLEGPIEIHKEGGDVRIAGVHADVDVEVRNGSIDVGMQGLPQNATVRLHTTNGTVTLTLPGSVGAEVEARTTTGAIRAEGLTFTRRKLDPNGAGARFTARLGRGGAQIDLQTENGSIVLREGRVVTLVPQGRLQAADSLDTAPTAPPDTSRARQPRAPQDADTLPIR